MIYTSAEAGKLLKQLNEELQFRRNMEEGMAVFEAAVGENLKDVRPEYDFETEQEKQLELEEKIRKVRHALVLFNSSTKVEGTDMTIDEALVYIPQLSARKEKLNRMRNRLPKTREKDRFGNNTGNIINYIYANYDIEKTREEYLRVSKKLADLQNALDLTNGRQTLEIDVEADI